MRTLAIETSCDDTSLALVSYIDGVFSCEKILTDTQLCHASYGWVVPEIASREHAGAILSLFNRFLMSCDIKKTDMSSFFDSISVTTSPWLPWSLMIGKSFASFLSIWYKIPLYSVNHLYWHVLSILLDRDRHIIQFPISVLSVSWWHSDIYIVYDKCAPLGVDVFQYWQVWDVYIARIWQTRDDAAGEAFDKVARMIGWPYPWWGWIGERAAQWKSSIDQYNDKECSHSLMRFKRTFLEKWTFDFSFSWMKSQSYNFLKRYGQFDYDNDQYVFDDDQINELAYEFQESITDVLSTKLFQAAEQYWTHTIAVVGGVSANIRLREKITEKNIMYNYDFLLPKKFEYCTDNAAMIGVAGLLELSHSG